MKNKNILLMSVLIISTFSITQTDAQDYRYRYKENGVILIDNIASSPSEPSNQAPVINTSSIDDATQDVSYTFTLSATDADGDILSWSNSGSFPNGLSLNSSTGEISGTPTESGDFNIDFTVSDGNGGTDTSNLTLSVLAACEIGAVGTICDDGAIYVGQGSDNIRRYASGTALSGARSFGLNGISIGTGDANFDGEGNTNILSPTYDATNDGTRTGTGAKDCRDLGAEWYLPAIEELMLIYNNNLKADVNGVSYSNSREIWGLSNAYLMSSSYTSTQVYEVNHNSGNSYLRARTYLSEVVCYRK